MAMASGYLETGIYLVVTSRFPVLVTGILQSKHVQFKIPKSSAHILKIQGRIDLESVGYVNSMHYSDPTGQLMVCRLEWFNDGEKEDEMDEGSGALAILANEGNLAQVPTSSSVQSHQLVSQIFRACQRMEATAPPKAVLRAEVAARKKASAKKAGVPEAPVAEGPEEGQPPAPTEAAAAAPSGSAGPGLVPGTATPAAIAPPPRMRRSPVPRREFTVNASWLSLKTPVIANPMACTPTAPTGAESTLYAQHPRADPYGRRRDGKRAVDRQDVPGTCQLTVSKDGAVSVANLFSKFEGGPPAARKKENRAYAALTEQLALGFTPDDSAGNRSVWLRQSLDSLYKLLGARGISKVVAFPTGYGTDEEKADYMGVVRQWAMENHDVVIVWGDSFAATNAISAMTKQVVLTRAAWLATVNNHVARALWSTSHPPPPPPAVAAASSSSASTPAGPALVAGTALSAPVSKGFLKKQRIKVETAKAEKGPSRSVFGALTASGGETDEDDEMQAEADPYFVKAETQDEEERMEVEPTAAQPGDSTADSEEVNAECPLLTSSLK